MNATKTPKRAGAAALFAVVLAVTALAVLAGAMLSNDATFASDGPSQQQLDADQAALAAVYTSLGKPVPNSPIYRWPNVTVQGGRITHVQIKYEGAPGAVSSRIGELTALRELRLAGSGIAGTLPASVGQLTELWYLAIDDTGINGPLPGAELAALPKLDTLMIDNNPSIGGPVPAELGQSSSIRDLILRRNGHTGGIPGELFFIEDQGPSPLARQLEHLNLEHNQLTGPIPTKMRWAFKLKTLWLRGNQLTGGLPEGNGWKRMSRLDVLQVDNNRMSGPLNPDLPALMPNLIHLSIYGNDWSGCLSQSYLQHYALSDLRPAELNIPRCSLTLASMSATAPGTNQISALTPEFETDTTDYGVLVSNQAKQFTINTRTNDRSAMAKLNSHDDADEETAGFQIKVASADALPTNVEISVYHQTEGDGETYAIYAERLDVDVARIAHEGQALPSLTVDEGQAFRLRASAVNAGESVSYVWTQTGGPAAETSGTNTDTVSGTAPQLDEGESATLTFQVKVIDAATGVHSRQNAALEVANLDTPPTGSIRMETADGPVAQGGEVLSGTQVTITADASDDDGDELQYSWRWRERPVGEEAYTEWVEPVSHGRPHWKPEYGSRRHYLSDHQVEFQVSVSDGVHDPVVLTTRYRVKGAGSNYTVRFASNGEDRGEGWTRVHWGTERGTHPYPSNLKKNGTCISQGALTGAVQKVSNPNAKHHKAHWPEQSAGWAQVHGPAVTLVPVTNKHNDRLVGEVDWAYHGLGTYYEVEYDIPQVAEETALGFRMWADLPVKGAQNQFERFETDVLTIMLRPCNSE